jgi:hypothetical protein
VLNVVRRVHLSKYPAMLLAKLAETEISVIQQFERRLAKPDAETISRLQMALEAVGAVFHSRKREWQRRGGSAEVQPFLDEATRHS